MLNEKEDRPSSEQLIEALSQNHGLISSAQDYLIEKFGIRVSRDWIKDRISIWGMQDFVKECRIRGVEKTFRKRLSNAIDDGNELSIGWMLAKYGHYVDFLEPKEEGDLDRDNGAISRYLEMVREESKKSKR